MENIIKIQVPIAVSYPALEGVLKQKLVGEYIPRPEEGADAAPYAQVLDVGVVGSSAGAQEIILRVKIKILRTVLKRDQVDLYVHATLGYDNIAQVLFVRKFNMEAMTTSGFYNTALEVLVNKVAYNQIIHKTRVSLKDIISKELTKANGLLETGLRLKGIKLTGAVNMVQVQDIAAQPEKITLSFELQGNIEVAVFDLINLMPPE